MRIGADFQKSFQIGQGETEKYTRPSKSLYWLFWSIVKKTVWRAMKRTLKTGIQSEDSSSLHMYIESTYGRRNYSFRWNFFPFPGNQSNWTKQQKLNQNQNHPCKKWLVHMVSGNVMWHQKKSGVIVYSSSGVDINQRWFCQIWECQCYILWNVF